MVVQVEASEQAAHVVSAAAVIALQSNDDSHPLLGSASLLNLLVEQAAMAVQVDALEVAADVHATHDVAPATEGHPITSHPLLTSPSSSNLLAGHKMPVQVEASEQAMQVLPVTGIAAQ